MILFRFLSRGESNDDSSSKTEIVSFVSDTGHKKTL